MRFRVRVSAALTTAALVLGGCNAVAPSVAPPTAGATELATVSPSAALATASPSAAALIPDGVYVSTPITASAVVAKIDGDSNLTEGQKLDLIDNAFQLRMHKSFVVSLQFAAGNFAQGEAIDRGPDEIGSRATFVFSDDHTLVLQEPSGDVTTFTVTWTGSSFALRVVSGANKEADATAEKILYESTPFTKAP
jgi:hypothetical protein